MGNTVFSLRDLVAAPIWLIVLYIVAFIISRKRYRDPFLRKHFLLGLTMKFIGCLGFVWVYGFYYNGGDTNTYYWAASELHDKAIAHPGFLWEILRSNFLNLQQQMTMDIDYSKSIWTRPSSYIVIRFAFLFSLITGKSYVAISLFFAFASYLGIWALYRVVCHQFADFYKIATIPALYIPSLFLWGSGLMKDTLVIGFIGLLTYGIYNLFFRKRKIFINLFLIISSFYVLTDVKQYVIFAYLPALILWMTLRPIKRMPRQVRWMLGPIILFFGVGVLFLIFPKIEQYSEQYALDQVMETAEFTAEYIHRTTREGGSSYSLGDVSYTPMGMLAAFPKAVIVTLFRPFLFEVRNPVMLFSALESTVFLIVTLYILFKIGLFRYFKLVSSDPFLTMCLLFSIAFSFAVGISTYNFGTLVRYKIPALPFYGFALLIPYMQFINKNKEKDKEKELPIS